MTNRVLMIAYHYPPLHGSSGLQRTISFVNDLPDEGWEPIVLSAHPRAYEQVSDDQLGDIREGTRVHRAFALDAKNHLSIGGRYFTFTALPDRWVSWALGAVPAGLRLIRKYRPQIIWTTYPIATAHLVGFALHRITGLPWVADFRDSMTEENFPTDPKIFNSFRSVERRTIENCSRATFTTPGAIRMYSGRYPSVPEDRWVLVPNGYNEKIFREVESSIATSPDRRDGPLKVVHSGILYPSERDPREFFAALAALKQAGTIDASRVQVILRATAHDGIYEPVLREYGLSDLVILAPSVAYREALVEMMTADGLLLFQAANCNHQIPAKLYEYLRAKKPILALTDPQGDTAGVLTGSRVAEVSPLDDRNAITHAFEAFLQRMTNGKTEVDDREVQKFSRRSSAGHLARQFEAVSGIAMGESD